MGSDMPGHEFGMSIRFNVCVAPDWAFKNFKVFHAFFAASFVCMAFTLRLWLAVPTVTFLLISSCKCCSRNSEDVLIFVFKVCFNDV